MKKKWMLAILLSFGLKQQAFAQEMPEQQNELTAEMDMAEMDQEEEDVLYSAMGAVNADVEARPLWEAKRTTDGRAWTLFTFNVLKTYGTALQKGAKDVTKFCPRYASLSENQKVNFWAYLISSMVKYESSFRPTLRYRESTMGLDPVTKQQVYSEGLMQLSYQDSLNWTFCNEFNWSKDKYLSPTDPNKTIFSPYKNLKCGIRILNRLVERKGYISFSSGHYWHVLKPTSSSLAKIKADTNAIPFCKK